MNKDYISWSILGAAVLVGVVVYLVVIGPMRAENRKLIEDKRFLAARFTPVKVEDSSGEKRNLTDGIKQLASGRKAKRRKMSKKDVVKLQKKLLGIPEETKKEDIPIEDMERVKVQAWDKKLYRLYPLSSNRKKLPSPKLEKAKRAEDKALGAARLDFVKKHFSARSFRVDPAKDFKPGPPDHIGLFREWVKAEDKRIDDAFLAAGKGIEFKLLKDQVKLFTPGRKLNWLNDGRVTGWIADGRTKTPRDKVLKRLVLRRQILMALARARASVRRLKRVGGADGEVKEKEETETRGLDKIVSLVFKEPSSGFGTGRRRKVPYAPNKVELTVSCHLAVVPALLRELEAIGKVRDQKSGELVQQRPFCFWAGNMAVTRVTGWPAALSGSRDLNSERAYGRYFEWPVKVVISGVIPEFNQKLDPVPRRK